MTDKELCDATGFTRELLKQYRLDMTEGVHFSRIKSKRPKHLWAIQWLDAGIEEIKKRSGMKPEEKIEPVKFEIKEVIANPSELRNQRLLRVKDGDTEIYALCRDSKMFKAGMKVTIRNDGQRWVVARHPRFFGKY